VARFRAAARGDAGAPLLLDGPHLVADALAAHIVFACAAVTPAARDREDVSALVARLTRAGVDVTTVSAPVMDAISPVRSSSGIVALAERPADGRPRIFSGADPLVVIAADVQDPGNVGAIVRVAEAGGASGVMVTGGSADPFGWKALRGSMGSVLRLPITTGETSDAAVSGAREHGCRIVATVPRDGRSLFDVNLTGPIALLVGGEGHGLDEGVIAGADERVTIPMETPVESLNAAVSAALIVYEARRQHLRQSAFDI
jgi:RNA methyltransferase, TrmH family